MTSNILLMTEDYKTQDKWFLYNHKFEYAGSVNKEVDCDDCAENWKKQRQLHYIVVIDSTTYYIPDYACVVGLDDSKLPADEHQHTQMFYADDMVKDALTNDDGTVDYVKGAKKYLNVDITPRERMDQCDHEGDWMLKKIQERYPNE